MLDGVKKKNENRQHNTTAKGREEEEDGKGRDLVARPKSPSLTVPFWIKILAGLMSWWTTDLAWQKARATTT